MRRKIGIRILILTILLIGVVSVSGAFLNISQGTTSKGEISEFNDSNN